MTNCLFSAIRLWLKSRGRAWLAVRRSVAFRGLIPHYSCIVDGEKQLIVIQYVPPTRQGDAGKDSYLLFDGYWQINRYRLEDEKRVKTLEEALHDS